MSDLNSPWLKAHWYPLAFSDALRPGARTRVEAFGSPLAVFRTDSGAIGVLEDRCPHRNVALSAGRCEGEALRCRYHGWAFSTDGECVDLPGLAREYDGLRRRARAYPSAEVDGLIWAFLGDDAPPSPPPKIRRPTGAFREVCHVVDMPGPLAAVIENALDVPHTAFLHRGLFRTGEPNRVSVETRVHARGVEARYIGEPRPSGLAGRILAPSGGDVEHWDRYVVPSTTEVEYRIGRENHVLVTAVALPMTDSMTRLFAIVRFQTRLPDRLIKPLIMPLAKRILAQDADVLADQAANVKRFGGERFSSTELDAIGPRVAWLMRALARGEDVKERTFPIFEMNT